MSDFGDEFGRGLAPETGEMVSGTLADQNAELRKRRSTRIVQAVPLMVTGVDALGRPFTERTSSLIINCHGCRYQSKHYVLKNMWVTLEIPHQEAGLPPRTVRGRVAWIQRPRTVRQLFQVALELEVPGNVWGIGFPPEDWFATREHQPMENETFATTASGQPEAEVVNPVPATGGELPSNPPDVEQQRAAIANPDNIRIFPSPISTTDASLQLARQVARLVADAKQQIQAAAREAASQAVGNERRAAFEQWEQKFAAAREEVAHEANRAIERIQSESESQMRAAHTAAADALRNELPKWLSPQLEQLTHDLTGRLSQAGIAQREGHANQIASLTQSVQDQCKHAEEVIARLHGQAEAAETLIRERAAAAKHNLEETIRQMNEAGEARQAALDAASNAIRRQTESALAEARSKSEQLLSTELESTRQRLQEAIENATREAREQTAASLAEHTQSVRQQLQEESARHSAAIRESADALLGGAQQQIGNLRQQVQDDVSRHSNELRETAESTVAAAHQHIASLHQQLEDESARHAATLEKASEAATAGAQHQLTALREQFDHEISGHGTALRESAEATVGAAQQQLASLREQVSEESSMQAAVVKEAAETAIGNARNVLNGLRDQLAEESARHASTLREAATSSINDSQRQFTALRDELSEQNRELAAKLAQARESSAQLENFSSRIGVAQQQALTGFESQLDDVLSLHRNELHRRSEALFEELNHRVRTTFEQSGREAVAKFDTQIREAVEPHFNRADEAIHRLAGGRSLLDAALTLQQDRIRNSADEAFAESLARFRESLGSVEQVLQDSTQSVTGKALNDLEDQINQAKHAAAEELSKTAEWYEKKTQTQLTGASEKLIEHTSNQLRERAGEVSGAFATELDRSSRGFVSHTQTQLEEVVHDAFERARLLFAEAADTTSAAFTDEIQRHARMELDGFGDEMQRSIGESRMLLDASRTDVHKHLTEQQEQFLLRFRSAMGSALEAGIADVQQKVQEGLTPLVNSWRAMVETEQQQVRDSYAKLSELATEKYSGRLENVSKQWMLATVSSLDHQSRDVVAGIAAAAEEKLRETCAQVFANVGDNLRQRMQQIASSFTPPDQTPKS